MRYERIIIDKAIFEAREKSVPLEMLFRGNDGRGIVYAPKSKIIIEGEEERAKYQSNTFLKILVPTWVFTSKGLNACQITNGIYVEYVNR